MTEIPNTINDFYRMSLMLSTNTKDIRAQAYEEMALGALLKLDHGTVKQISDEIASTPPHFRPVDFILGDVLGNLVHSGKIQKTNSQYSITETERQRLNLLLEERLYEIVSIEKNWLSEMRERALLPIDLLPSDRETIIQDLRGVCLRLYEIRGDEYVDFYTKKKKSLEINLDKSTIRDNLPKNRPDYLLKIEEDIIPRFFIGTDARQISYIGRFAQIYVRLCALNVETKGQQILEEKLDGVEVFLDTNIIFALFGLCQGGPLEVKTATERLIGINRTLGVEQIVSSLTIEEFLCCKNAAKAGGLGPMVPDTLDELGEDIYPEDSFAYAFWREMHAKGLQN